MLFEIASTHGNFPDNVVEVLVLSTVYHEVKGRIVNKWIVLIDSLQFR